MGRWRGVLGAVTLLAALVLGFPSVAPGATTGQLYAFGINFFGQLGNATNAGTTNPNPTPTPVALPGATGPITQVAAGLSHTLTLTSTGQLYAFGNNFNGQLGNATNTGTGKANPTPTLVVLPARSGAIAHIAAGYAHSLVMTSAGQLYAFGDNGVGELGSPINSGTNVANPAPLSVGLPTGMIATAVAAGVSAIDTLVLLTNAPSSSSSTSPSSAASAPGVPALSGLRVSPRTVSLTGRLVDGRCVKPTGTNRKHTRCRRPIAAKISYTLNLAATVTFTFTRRDPGRKIKGRCVTPGKANQRHRPCTRATTIPGSIRRTSAPGSNSFTFDGHIAGRLLGPGNYLVIATPTASTNQGTPRTIVLRLVR
jgi:Regulator of chromosome condensation (RCC1) repeat